MALPRPLGSDRWGGYIPWSPGTSSSSFSNVALSSGDTQSISKPTILQHVKSAANCEAGPGTERRLFTSNSLLLQIPGGKTRAFSEVLA